jgi:hypothetical protein
LAVSKHTTHSKNGENFGAERSHGIVFYTSPSPEISPGINPIPAAIGNLEAEIDECVVNSGASMNM